MHRTVVVTGASRGIGRAIAARFAIDGADVVITGRDATTLEQVGRALGARAQVCDGSRPEHVRALVAAAGDRVDVLVNCAGGNTDFGQRVPVDAPLEDVAAQWRANLDANVLSAVLTTTAFEPALAEGGTVVNVSSIGAEYAATSYGAAKAAVAAWTAGLSARLGPRGITVNAIAPGYIEGTEFFRGTLSDERRASLVAATHDKRAGTTEDIAATVFFLASSGARHITGQTIHVNGGAHTTR